MMHALVGMLFFFAQPFWEAKPPEKWTGEELHSMLSNSPWAQVVPPDPAMLLYLATAKPIEDAEAELRVRGGRALREPDPDYASYLTEHRGEQLVLAIAYPKLPRVDREREYKRMEQETVMLIGRAKKFKMTGHFAPTQSDPVLRIAFPREVLKTDKTVTFQLYLPGIDFPEREITFQVKDLIYRGELEM